MAWSDVSDDDKLRCAMLWELVWPSGGAADTTARLEKMVAYHNAQTDHTVGEPSRALRHPNDGPRLVSR